MVSAAKDLAERARVPTPSVQHPTSEYAPIRWMWLNVLLVAAAELDVDDDVVALVVEVEDTADELEDDEERVEEEDEEEDEDEVLEELDELCEAPLIE